MRWAALTAASFTLSAVLLAGCGESTAAHPEDETLSGRLVLTGSSTIAPLAGEIAKAFEERYPGARVDVQSGGSSQGIADIRRGTADVGMVSRALSSTEDDLDAWPIAMDGIALIVHRDNPVRVLPRETVIDIFTGEIRDWESVGGMDRAITVVNKAEGRSTLELFLEHFELTSADIRADVVIGENQQGIRSVAGNQGAIGYVSIGTAAFEAARGTPIRLLPLDGVEAANETVASGAYPLARPLNLVTQGERSPLADAFLEFAASAEIHPLVEGQSFVPLAK